MIRSFQLAPVVAALCFCLPAPAASDGVTAPGTPSCFGDGSGADCPCDNPGNAGEGCAHINGVGAILAGSGEATVGNDSLVLHGSQLNGGPGFPLLIFQADTLLGGGIPFGHGLRCCGENLVRLSVAVTDFDGCIATDGSCGTMFEGPLELSTAGRVSAGDTACYQAWYRDPASVGPCSNSFNFTNAYVVTWD